MAIKSHGALASLELNHGGLYNPPEAMGGRNPIGPVSFVRSWDGVEVIGMDEAMMNTVADHFADAAELRLASESVHLSAFQHKNR